MKVADKRKQFRDKYIGRFYSPFLHIIWILSLCAGGCWLALRNLLPMQVLDLTIILLILLYASLSVYISHRYHQHRVIGGLAFLHKFHTVEHHALFNEIKMIQEQRKDLYMILFPPSIAAFLILIFYPFIGYLMSLLFYSRVAWLYYLVACSYYLVYEFVHFVCHQPENSFLRKLPVLKYLAAHHQKHHNRRLMGQANFGIVTTFWDYMFKTKV